MNENRSVLYLQGKLAIRSKLYIASLLILCFIASMSVFAPGTTSYLSKRVVSAEEKSRALQRENALMKQRMESFVPPCMVRKTFVATAYESSSKSCGVWAKTHTTRSGTTPAKLRSVAVDPDIVSLGSLVYIEPLGWFVAEDTGSAISGKSIDVFMDSIEEAESFGRKEVAVFYQDKACFDSLVSAAKHDRSMNFFALNTESGDSL